MEIIMALETLGIGSMGRRGPRVPKVYGDDDPADCAACTMAALIGQMFSPNDPARENTEAYIPSMPACQRYDEIDLID